MVIDESLTGFGVRLRTSKPASMRHMATQLVIGASMLLMAHFAKSSTAEFPDGPP